MNGKLKAIQELEEMNSIDEPIGGRLGIPLGGVRTVDVPNRPGFVYVRLRDNPNELIQAFNQSVSPVYDLPVLVEFRKNRYVVLGRDIDRYSSWGSAAPYLAAHGSQHSLLANQAGGGDPVWVDGRQMMPGAVYPSGTLGGPNVLVSEFIFRNKFGNWLYIGNTGTVDLNPLRPSGTNARLALVCLDYSNGGFVILTGSLFSSSLTGTNQIFSYLPPTNLEQVPLAAVRIVSGTTSIGWDNIYDARQWIDSGYLTGSSGGSGNGDFIGPISSTDNAIVRFDGTDGKHGQNSSVVIDDGGNTHLNITGSSIVFSQNGADLIIPSSLHRAVGFRNDGRLWTRDENGDYKQYAFVDEIPLDGWVPETSTWTYSSGVQGTAFSRAYTNDPASGSNIALNMGNTSGFNVGDTVVVSSSAGAEQATIVSIVVNTSITVNSLSLNHTTVSPLVYRPLHYQYVVSVNADMTQTVHVGNKLKLTQTSQKYFVVVAVGSYSGGATLITLFGGTDYELTSGAISAVYYSSARSPFGFPMDRSKWTIRKTDTSNLSLSSPTADVWQNVGTMFSCGFIGSWEVRYSVDLAAIINNVAVANVGARSTLSTGYNTASDADLTADWLVTLPINATAQLRQTLKNLPKIVNLSSPTVYFLNAVSSQSLSSFAYRGDISSTVIEFICAYI